MKSESKKSYGKSLLKTLSFVLKDFVTNKRGQSKNENLNETQLTLDSNRLKENPERVSQNEDFNTTVEKDKMERSK